MVDQNIKQQIGQNYINGMSVPDIMSKHSVSKTVLYKILKQLNVSVRGKKVLNQENEKLLAIDYNNGMSTGDISKKYNVSYGAIWTIAHRNGARQRTIGEMNTKYEANKDYFKSIDNETKSYIVGFISADGTVDQNQRTIEIALHEQDRCIVEKIRDEIQPDKPLYSPSKKYNHIKFQISNRSIWNDLVALGVSPKKTFSLNSRPAQIPIDLLSAYYRGYFDGDGGLSFAKNHGNREWRLSLCATEPFINEFQDWLIENDRTITKISVYHPKHTAMCSYNKGGTQQIVKICHLLYDNATIYLPRKYEKAMEIIESTK